MTKLAVFLNPVHGRPTDVDFIGKLQPASVKIVNPDVQKVSDVYKAAPGALIVLRHHARSEEHDAAYADPEGTGARHAQADIQMVQDMRAQAAQRALSFPGNLAVCGLNEPHVWTNLDQAVRYYVAYLDGLASLKGIALSLSVGWPANTGAGTPVDRAPYRPVYDAIKRGGHMLGLHEYWSHDGPQNNWRWWAGRYLQCPWDVPILIGECGIDSAVADGNTDYLKRGWRAKLSAQQYIAQLAQYDAELMKDSRIHSAQIFTTDGAREWFSFDTEPAHEALLAYTPISPPSIAPWIVGDPVTPVVTVNIRQVPGYGGAVVGRLRPGDTAQLTGGPVVVDGLVWWQTAAGWMAQAVDGAALLQKVAPQSDWDKSIAFVLRWEGGYANNPSDPGGEANFGISKRSYPNLDIKNLTRDQAVEIYRRDYWQGSGANGLPWPLCLVHLDSAVNCGVTQAQKWLAQSGGSVTRYVALRLEFYTEIGGWAPFGAAWARRVADLLATIGK